MPTLATLFDGTPEYAGYHGSSLLLVKDKKSEKKIQQEFPELFTTLAFGATRPQYPLWYIVNVVYERDWSDPERNKLIPVQRVNFFRRWAIEAILKTSPDAFKPLCKK